MKIDTDPKHPIFKLCIETIRTMREGISKKEAFEIFIEWLCIKFSLEEYKVTPWITEEASKILHEAFSVKTLGGIPAYKVDSWDWLGKLAQEYGYIDPAKDGKDYLLLSKEDAATITAQKMIDLNVDPNGSVFTVSDVGTGQIIFDLINAGADAVFAAEGEIEYYRIALLNITMYDLPAGILKADDKYDLNVDSPNWKQYANLWTPPNKNSLSKKRKGEI